MLLLKCAHTAGLRELMTDAKASRTRFRTRMGRVRVFEGPPTLLLPSLLTTGLPQQMHLSSLVTDSPCMAIDQVF